MICKQAWILWCNENFCCVYGIRYTRCCMSYSAEKTYPFNSSFQEMKIRIIAFVFASIDFWYRQHDQFISEFFVKSILFQIFKSEVDYYWITSSLFKSQFFNSHDQRLTDHRWNRKSPAEKGRSLFMNMSWDFWMQNAISQNLVFCLGCRSYQTKSQIPEIAWKLRNILLELTIDDRDLQKSFSFAQWIHSLPYLHRSFLQ